MGPDNDYQRTRARLSDAIDVVATDSRYSASRDGAPIVGQDARHKAYAIRGGADRGLWIGSAEQQGMRHYLFQASGEAAALSFNYTCPLPIKATRIDLQCTIPLPRGWSHRNTYEALKAANPGLALSIVESGDGFDTLYIGRRASRRFIRVYIKPDGNGEPWLRFEVEYKKELADKVWQETKGLSNPVQAWGKILLGEGRSIKGWPLCLYPLWDRLQAFGAGERPGGERRETGGATWRWLKTQVDPAIRRALYDHEQSHDIRGLIETWWLECQMLDDQDEST